MPMPFRASRLFIILFVLVLIPAAVLYPLLRDLTDPTLTLSPDTNSANKQLEFRIDAKDPGSGLKSIVATVSKEGKTVEVFKKSFPNNDKATVEKFSLGDLPFKDGEFTLEVVVHDASFAGFGRGNRAKLVKTMLLDTVPPMITLLSTNHLMKQGGAGGAAFRSNKKLSAAWVEVRDLKFPAYELRELEYSVLFPFPWFMDQREFAPQLVAVDMAGNSRKSRLPTTTQPGKFKHDKIGVSDKFLEAKDAEFQLDAPEGKNMLERFLLFNRKIREANQQKLYELARDTAPKPLWQGPFRRFEGKPLAGFGDKRTYLYQNQPVDEQTHTGHDIAHLERTPVYPGNAGRVVFADRLGIYGLAVIVDHGMGLQSLYSHMSEIGVNRGDPVDKSTYLGRTGSTGMAYGDHLHFQMMLGGVSVSPIEWWDNHWITDNILDKLNPVPAVQTGPPSGPPTGPPSFGPSQAPQQPKPGKGKAKQEKPYNPRM